ncbi:hypothetical protein [Polyangium mundeleinium]|uniref:Uncharacterized protein n=1 Tax=Polyangium mundeleinium TaxID=2995306 RepID=A0ABT5EKR8_9BACT|nr:hypothetical protein [Polyangium mundeleinium]MDC0742356.1 hypothetical protein [Polyangium mundeleinium]
MEHACAGVCAGNTPATGCFTSTTCTPCPTAQNGAAVCNTTGLCDVSCNAGYVKNGVTCVCQSQCCADADCAAGQTCMGGTCTSSSSSSSSGGGCDLFACIFTCGLQSKDCDPFTCTCI